MIKKGPKLSTLFMNFVLQDGNKLILNSEEDCKQLHNLLRDFASLLQIVGRLSHLFIGEVFQDRITIGNEFMKHLIAIVSFSCNKKLYSLETPLECLANDFIEVHAQALGEFINHFLSIFRAIFYPFLTRY